nr:unnamed protein product [Callosobruchus analis]
MPFSRQLQSVWSKGTPVGEAEFENIKSYLHLIPLADHRFYANFIGNDTLNCGRCRGIYFKARFPYIRRLVFSKTLFCKKEPGIFSYCIGQILLIVTSTLLYLYLNQIGKPT